LAAVACDDHIIGSAVPIGTGCTRDPPLTYANFGKGILDRHCNGCHSDFIREDQRGGAPLNVNLNKWDYVLQWADQIEADAVVNLTMPPTGTMTPLERAQLGEWMQCDVLPQIGEVQQGPSGGGSS
jgi:cytochrome c5